MSFLVLYLHQYRTDLLVAAAPARILLVWLIHHGSNKMFLLIQVKENNPGTFSRQREGGLRVNLVDAKEINSVY